MAFGTDPAAYHEARPEYPAKIYEILKNRCGLAPGSRTFEVGPGTGLASTKLLELGASPLVLIEPDKRLAKFLKTRLLPAAGRLQIENASFEDVQLNSRSFDLGIAASSFHWMNERPMLRKAARLLRSGGWWAMWWHVFRDLSRPSEFQRATHQLLSRLDRGPSWAAEGQVPFALSTEERTAALRAVKGFQRIAVATVRGSMVFNTVRLINLYASFSPIRRLRPAERNRILEGLRHITEKDFQGAVKIPIVTPMYIAQRR